MPDKDMLAFLAGMKIYDADIEMRDDVVVAVATVGGPFMEYHSEEEHASWIVTAAHEYAERHPSLAGTTHWAGCWAVHGECAKALLQRWWPAIEAAEAWHPLHVMALKTDDVDMTEDRAITALFNAIAAALKEGNADG